MKELVTQLTSANNKMKADKDAIEKKYGELEDQVKGLSDKVALKKSSYSDVTFKSNSKPSSTSTSKLPIPDRKRKPAPPQSPSSRPSFNSNTKVKSGEFGFGGRRRRIKKGRKSRRGRKTRKH